MRAIQINIWAAIQIHVTHYCGITFACLNALEPRVTEIGVVILTTILEPITTASTTTVYAGCLEGAALAA